MPAPVQKTVNIQYVNLPGTIDGINPNARSARTRYWPSTTDHSTQTTGVKAKHIEYDAYTELGGIGTLLGSGSIDTGTQVCVTAYGVATVEALLQKVFEG